MLGSLSSAVNLYRSCIGLGWLAQETTGLDWFGPLRSNNLRPVSSCRVPELGVLAVGVTSWSGEVSVQNVVPTLTSNKR
jgi:hypothetical protein